MGRSVVIVESPAKARTIEKFLGKDFKVEASMGHVRDLPQKVRGEDIGVDVEHDFRPTYQVLPDKKKVIDGLKKAAKNAEAIYLAADPDREGEAICWHLQQVLARTTKAPIHRVLFHEITRRAVRGAIETPGEIDQHKVDAQQARRVLDRLVGYKISPLLWKKARFGLSAGRVQTVALRMVVEREREIRDFDQREYWSVTAQLEGETPPSFESKLVEWKGAKPDLPDEAAARAVLEGIEGQAFRVDAVEAKERKRNPAPPFTTSKLQQDAARRFGLPVSRTMRLAQNLYEGKELGDRGAVGLITYMRTDSVRVSEEALGAVRELITATYGQENLPEKPRYYRKKKDSQDAHEAIRPTDVSLTPRSIARYLKPEELKLYTLIWNRFVASQMKAAVYDTMRVDIRAGEALFRATGSVLKFQGYLAVYQVQDAANGEAEDAHEGENPDRLPALAAGTALTAREVLPHQHFTQPPARYTEASLVKALEENGIGRPSTYASILNVLQRRDYAKKVKKSFRPTPLGEVLVDPLVDAFGDLFQVPYTAKMEEDLDEIEEGQASWVSTVRKFYKEFARNLEAAGDSFPNLKKGIPARELPQLRPPVTCTKCQSELVVRIGKFGPFIACSSYPDCDFTAELLAEENGEANGEIEVDCPSCGLPMGLKRGRWGSFLACSGYPDCKTTQKIQIKEGQVEIKKEEVLEEKCPDCEKPLAKKHGRYGEYVGCTGYPDCRYVKRETTGVPCPRCGGDIVARRSKRGRTFYGCSGYPKCDFVVWKKPVARKCPKCANPYLVESTTKRWGERLLCDNEKCDYAEVLRAPDEMKAAARRT